MVSTVFGCRKGKVLWSAQLGLLLFLSLSLFRHRPGTPPPASPSNDFHHGTSARLLTCSQRRPHPPQHWHTHLPATNGLTSCPLNSPASLRSTSSWEYSGSSETPRFTGPSCEALHWNHSTHVAPLDMLRGLCCDTTGTRHRRQRRRGWCWRLHGWGTVFIAPRSGHLQRGSRLTGIATLHRF